MWDEIWQLTNTEQLQIERKYNVVLFLPNEKLD